jgi:gas vesicle structural protein
VSASEQRPLQQQVTLIDLVDRVLNKGVVLSGDITLSVAGVDLVYVGLRVLLASVGTLERLDGQSAGETPAAVESRR